MTHNDHNMCKSNGTPKTTVISKKKGGAKLTAQVVVRRGGRASPLVVCENESDGVLGEKHALRAAKIEQESLATEGVANFSEEDAEE